MAEPIVLTTERLTLRAYRFEDVDAVLAYASDPDWARYLPVVPDNYTRGDAEAFIAASVLLDPEEYPRWAIVHDGVSGGIDLRIDRGAAAGELGYSLAPWLWGRGLMPEAAGAVIDWAFAQLDIAKVSSRADARNRQSWRVMEKLGMQREAVLRSVRVHRGERYDEVWYGILREEWAARRGAG